MINTSSKAVREQKQYGFLVDSTRCTGCKTCEAACSDFHQLPLTMSFRRVCEYSGGSWQQYQGGWKQDVFSYYLSIACNHCDNPICERVCPSGATNKHPDGFVLIDPLKCIGCGSCAFACPYSAPSLDSSHGIMRKCDACRQRIKEDRAPICVEACPMRALAFGLIDDLRCQYGDQAGIAPLPDPEYTSPNITVKAQKHCRASDDSYGDLANEREI